MPTRTRFKELSFHEWGRGNWRFVTEDGAEVGPSYATKAELLADLERYATDYGCAGAGPSALDVLREACAAAVEWYGADYEACARAIREGRERERN